MSVWAIADLHLALATPEKSMEAFGEPWLHYTEKIETHWRERIGSEDLVLIAGDISWAMRPLEARTDLEWIGALPGTKVLIRGNHDYWWSSLSQIQAILPPSMHLIQNNAFCWKDLVIAGARLWDTPEYQFGSYIQVKESAPMLTMRESPAESEKIFMRELGRLERSLQAMQETPSSFKIAMTHYPPIGATLEPSRASLLLEKYQINFCVFGHLHSLKKNLSLFGQKNGVNYQLTSADYLNFIPFQIA